MRIVVVDENDERVEIVRQGLRAAGHAIVATIGPRDDLLATLEAVPADFVIASMSSPDRDTLDGLRAVTARNPKPIVLFVDHSDAALARDAVDAGVSAYIVKGLAADLSLIHI